MVSARSLDEVLVENKEGPRKHARDGGGLEIRCEGESELRLVVVEEGRVGHDDERPPQSQHLQDRPRAFIQ
jgi:hypothetical protein